MKLDARQMALLGALVKGPVNTEGCIYRCVGAGSRVPIRYNYWTLPRMVDLGLCSRSHMIFRMTDAGLAAWRAQRMRDVRAAQGCGDAPCMGAGGGICRCEQLVGQGA